MKTGERLVPIREIKSAGQASFLANKDPWPADVADDAVLLEVKHLTKRFSIKKSGFLFKQPSSSTLAVDDVSFFIRRGECLGLVGESGCG
ncbi:hypothetical protein ACO1K9_13760, partial [Staphylococcus aureus]